MAVLARLAGEVIGRSARLGLLAGEKRSVDVKHTGSITYLGIPVNKKGTAEAVPCFLVPSQSRSEGGVHQDLDNVSHLNFGES